jgi:uncharacterized repeat protein (TIGR01451 family)
MTPLSRLVRLLKLGGLVVMAATGFVLVPGSAVDDEVAAQANEVLLGPMYGKAFNTVAEAPMQACQQLSGPLGQMEWSDRGATDQGLLSLGLVAKTGAIPFTISRAEDCTWVAVGSDFTVPASDSYDVEFVMDVSGALVLNGITSVGCDAERAGAQLFAFLWDQETGDVVTSSPISLPGMEKPTLDHDGCSAQPAVVELFGLSAGAVEKVTKVLKLGDSSIPLKDLGYDGAMLTADSFLWQASSWPEVQKIDKQGYEFSFEGPVRLDSGKKYGVGVGLFSFVLSLASAGTGAGYATALFEAGSYELYDWPTNFKIEIGPTRLTGIRISRAGSKPKATTTATPSGTQAAGADLFVTKLDSPDPVGSGGNITYTLVVTNTGSAPATDARVDDDLPPEATFLSASPGCTKGATLSCNIGTLAPGETAKFTITVTAPTVTSQISVKNCAFAYASNEENIGNNRYCQRTDVNPPPTPGLATPTPGLATPTPGLATPTPGLATPTLGPATPTPGPATPTPELATPTPTPGAATPTPTPEPRPQCLDAPSDLSANMHWSGGAAWVELSWQDNSDDEEGFRVERATSAAGPYAVIAMTSASSTGWTDYALEFGPDNYYYRIEAYRQGCDSEPSNVATVPGRWPTPTSAPVCATIEAPSGLVVTRQYESDGRFFVDLQWQDNSTEETGFAVQRAVVPGGPWGYVASLGPDSTEFTDEPPIGPRLWYYRILAQGAEPCYSEPSNIVVAFGR